MKKHLLSILGISSVALTALIVSSCKSNSDSSGFEYMPDMYRSPAIEAYVDYGEIRGRENAELKTKLTALTPPRNTVPYIPGKDTSEIKLSLTKYKPSYAFRETHGLFGFDYSPNDVYLGEAANDKQNPYALNSKNSEEILKKGKELFTAMCQHCHGENGDGNGPMVKSGAYSGVPNYKNLNLSDGQIFYSIYFGKGMMGAHGSLLSKKEIWTLVHYVRQFQNKDYGKFDANGLPVAMVAAAVDSIKMKP